MVKGKLYYRIFISMRHVSLERARIGCGTRPRDVILAETLFEVLNLLKLMKKVDARMDYPFRNRLEAWNHIKLTDHEFSCLPTSNTNPMTSQ